MVKFKDTSFLHASSRIKSLEKYLLGPRQLIQMVEAHNNDEAYKIVADAGIGVGTGIREYEHALRENLLQTYRMLEDFADGTNVFDLFRYEYDGLNLKVLIKAQALGKAPDEALTPLGTVPPETLTEQMRAKRFEGLHPRLAAGALEALDVLAKTGDPQSVGILLDKAVLAAMHETAQGFDNRFIRSYVRSKIDISNIRCLVRIHRIGGGNDFFRRVVALGGAIGENQLTDAYSKGIDAIIALIEASDYGAVLEPAMATLRAGGSLTLFEKLCDNYMVRLLDDARLIPFGIEPLIVYLCAKENEIKAVRIVLASRLAGVDPEQIKERLRESYAR